MELEIQKNGITYTVIYDQEDHELLTKYKWHLHTNGYVYARVKEDAILMHRLILGLGKHDKLVCDHINHNKLDNRRSNIRACTRSDNQKNVTPYGKSKYLGVSIQRRTNKNGSKGVTIKATIKNGKYKYLGTFKSEEAAARAYDAAAKEIHGEFANLNFK